jgi:hypothetical protein
MTEQKPPGVSWGTWIEITEVNSRVAEGPPTRRPPLDADAIVEEWRRRSAPKEKSG